MLLPRKLRRKSALHRFAEIGRPFFEESGKRLNGFRRTQPLAECDDLDIGTLQNFSRVAAHQLPRHGQRFRRFVCEPPSRIENRFLETRGWHNLVYKSGLRSLFRRKRFTQSQHFKGTRVAHPSQHKQARCGFRNQPEGQKRRCKFRN